jgi:hypothetical protein
MSRLPQPRLQGGPRPGRPPRNAAGGGAWRAARLWSGGSARRSWPDGAPPRRARETPPRAGFRHAARAAAQTDTDPVEGRMIATPAAPALATM